jgi:hypothetical protein
MWVRSGFQVPSPSEKASADEPFHIEAEKGTAGVIAYTIVSRAYVPHARVLARSFARHHPGEKLWVLLIDDVDRTIDDRHEPFFALRLEDLDVDVAEIHRMALLFGGKLIAVIKPWVFDHFLSRGSDSVLYIDGDFVIFDSLQAMVAASNRNVILVPHVLNPIPQDGKDPSETAILGAGMFNAGMFGVGSAHGGFIEFLQERLRRECIFDAPRMRFNEQRWLDFVPALFPHHVVRDPGVDVAYWNLHERPLSKRDGNWFAGGAALRAFHFSSFDPRTTGVGGRYELDPAPRVQARSDPLFAELCDGYRQALLADGFTDQHDSPFGLETLPDGLPVYHGLRALFAQGVADADAGVNEYPPDPYEVTHQSAFHAWAAAAYEHEGVAMPRGLFGVVQRESPSPSMTAQRSSASNVIGGVRARFRRSGGGRAGDPEASSNGGPESDAAWSIDWLDRMIVDEAGVRLPACIKVLPEKAGFVCHGPRAPLGPGKYRATLEFDCRPHAGIETTHEQALVVEAFVQGYVIGSRAATFAEVEAGTLTLAISIPRRFTQEALLFGVEIRVLSRGRLAGNLIAVLMEALHGPADDEPDHARVLDWLPVMAGGSAGLRSGVEVATVLGESGVVVSGPNWRLVSGRYQVHMTMRLLEPPVGVPQPDGAATLAVLQVLANENMLADSQLGVSELASGDVTLGFVVPREFSGPASQIGVCLKSEKPFGGVVTSITVEYLGELVA